MNLFFLAPPLKHSAAFQMESIDPSVPISVSHPRLGGFMDHRKASSSRSGSVHYKLRQSAQEEATRRDFTLVATTTINCLNDFKHWMYKMEKERVRVHTATERLVQEMSLYKIKSHQSSVETKANKQKKNFLSKTMITVCFQSVADNSNKVNG